MKSYLADIRQIFNAKAFAAAGLDPGAIPNDTLGIVNVATGLTVAPGNFAALPDEFKFVGKVGGAAYYGVESILKANIIRKNKKDYSAAVANIWSTTITCCSCIEAAVLNIGVDDASLTAQEGLTWLHRDVLVEVSPKEMKCFCSCDGSFKVYENNIMTMLFVNKINSSNSPFYTASSGIDITGADTGSTLPVSDQVEGDVYVKTGASAGTYVYVGGSWELVGDANGVLTDLDAFVELMKELNTDVDAASKGPMVKLILTSIIQPTPNYADLDVNYVYPRGARLTPSISLGDSCSVGFTEDQEMEFAIGEGYDFRAEEWDSMNNYTTLNYAPRLSDGIQSPNLKYQFANGVNYNAISFEFTKDKTEFNSGEKRLFGVVIGIPTTATATYTALKNALGL